MSGRFLSVAYLFQSAGINFSENGALQVHTYHTVKGLQARGHRVALVFNIPGRRVLCTENLQAARSGTWRAEDYADLGPVGWRSIRTVESGVRRVQFGLGLPYFALFDSYRMREACCRNLSQPDLLHERYNLLSLGGTLAARRMGVPLVIEVNGDIVAESDYLGESLAGILRWSARWATKLTLDAASRVIAVTDGLKAHLAASWGVPEGKIDVLPNAADVQAFGGDHDVAALRRELGLGGDPVVMFVGGFYEWHGLDTLVDAFRKVRQAVPAARLVLVGDGRVRGEIARHVEQDGMAPSVLFTGVVAHERIPALLSLADVAVSPLIPKGWEIAPLKLFEYMAAGKAIVASAVDGVDKVISHEETGLLCQPSDPESLANAIIDLLRDPVERARLGGNARRRAVARHSWERYVERLEEIYAGVLAERR